MIETPAGVWWALFLNDMRSAKIEWQRPAIKARTKEQLERAIKRLNVATYTETDEFNDNRSWGKSFEKGSVLEWYNQPSDYGGEPYRIVISAAAVQLVQEVMEFLFDYPPTCLKNNIEILDDLDIEQIPNVEMVLGNELEP